MHNKNYKYRLSFILLFVFLFAVTVSAFSYFLSVTARQKQAQEQLILQRFSNYFENLNNSMLSTFQSLSFLAQKESLKDFAYARNNEERSLASITVQKDIQSIMLSGNYLAYCQIAVAYAKDPQQALIITQDSSYSMEQYALSIGMAPAELKAMFTDLESKPYGNVIAHSVTSSQKEYIHYTISLPNIDSSLMIILSIDKENFVQAFSFPEFQDWLIYSGDRILFTKYSGEDNSDYSSLIPRLNAADTASSPVSRGVVKTKLIYQGNPLVSASFAQIGWQFAASYTPKGVTIADIFLLFLLPLLFLFVCSLLPVRLISQYLYAPIGQVVTQLGGKDRMADNEFEFIYRKTSQISQKAKELDEDLRQNQRLLREQLVRSAFLGQSISPDNIQSRSFLQSEYIAVYVEMIDEDTESRERFPIYKAALQESILPLENADYINMGTTSFALILACESQTSARDAALNLFTRIDLLSKVQVQAALSDKVFGLQNLHKACEQCNRLLEYRYLLTDHLFITPDDLLAIYSEGYHYSLKTENMLLEQVLSGTDGALTLLEEILRENLVDTPLSPENKQAFFLALCSTLSRIYQELHITADSEFMNIAYLLQNSSQDKIETQIRSAFARIVKQTQKHHETMTQDISLRMMNYIYENYSLDISLDSIAGSLNISPKYCSALFKKETGNTFRRFLNEYRIEKAKQVLSQNPDIRIGLLAEQMGFTNANTFIQVFKQYTQTTPRQYAERFFK